MICCVFYLVGACWWVLNYLADVEVCCGCWMAVDFTCMLQAMLLLFTSAVLLGFAMLTASVYLVVYYLTYLW